MMPEDIAQEYLTGEEFLEEAEEEVELQPVQDPADQTAGSAETEALRARVLELENLMKASGTLPQTQSVGATAKPAGKAPPLFPGPQPGQLSQSDWTRLQRLAGPPPRAGAAETRRPAPTTSHRGADNALHLLEQEAEANAPVEEAITTAMAQSGDPIQQLLFAQLRQNQVLLEKLTAPRHADPLVNMLDGSGSASGSGGSGVRGCIARDAYVRTMLDVTKLAEIFEQNAMKELGLPPERVDGSLMLKYVERRLPVSESRLMTYLAFMMADAWSVGHASDNHELMGIAGKALMFLEQAALDQGRLQLAWLLTGRQDPPFNILQSNKRKTGLFPFSKLAAAPWIAANLAFVKDIDMLESKTLAMQKSAKPTFEEQEVVDPKPKKPPKNPKAKWKGKGQDEGSTTN